MTGEQLIKMSEMDIRNVDPEMLVDIATLEVDNSKSKTERIKDYIQQIKNPYCFLSHGVKVKITFVGTNSLEECLVKAMEIQ